MLFQRIRSKVLVFSLWILLFSNLSYPNEEIDQYILPQKSWLSNRLDEIFSSEDILKNSSAFKKAGFNIIHHQRTGMKVAKHPLLPGYLVKAYLSTKNLEGVDWAVDRCIGAERISLLIKEENLTCFTVPKKWIYVVSSEDPVIVILVVEDMQIVSNKESEKIWKNPTKTQLQQLYTILSHGFSSCYLIGNIPYTKSGKFSCVDTAYPYRVLDLNLVKQYFSSKKKKQWDLIVKNGEESRFIIE